MAKRTYGQHGGVAHALGILGERWALLIVRDLLVGPQRFTDLRRSLVKIPSNVLTSRLRELELAGVIERIALPRPESAVVYRLTAYGSELEPIVQSLARWGAQTLGEPEPGDIMTISSLTLALRTSFDAEAARGANATFEIRAGEITLGLRIDDGQFEITPEAGPRPDLVMETGPAILGLLAGAVSPADALNLGIVTLEGPRELFDAFTSIFRLGRG